MIGLIQRVSKASVSVDNKIIANIDKGILLLLGVEKEDDNENAKQLLNKVLNFRIFEDNHGKMNLSLLDINGELLIVPQFTLPADTKKGTRPSFAKAAPPEKGLEYFNQFVALAKQKTPKIALGEFGADMKVSLVNDGPVTFWLQK